MSAAEHEPGPEPGPDSEHEHEHEHEHESATGSGSAPASATASGSAPASAPALGSATAPASAPAPARSNKLRITLLLLLSIALAFGARYVLQARRVRAPEAAARVFIEDLFSGQPKRAWSETSSRFRARNEAAAFEAEFARGHAPVEVRFFQHDVRGDRATFQGRLVIGSDSLPITVFVVREDGGFRVDDFHIDP